MPALWRAIHPPTMMAAPACGRAMARPLLCRRAIVFSCCCSFPFRLDMFHRPRCGYPRELSTFLFDLLPNAGAFLLLPQKGRSPSLLPKEGAERRKAQLVLSVLLRGARAGLAKTGSPYGAPLRCLNGGTPLPRRAAMAIAPWPCYGDATEDSIRGSLVSREAFSTRLPGARLANHARGHRSPSTLSSLCRAPLSEWGYVRHTQRTGQCQAVLKIIMRCSVAALREDAADVCFVPQADPRLRFAGSRTPARMAAFLSICPVEC